MRLGVNFLHTARLLNGMRMMITIFLLISADWKFLKQMSHCWAIYMQELVQQLKIARRRHLFILQNVWYTICHFKVEQDTRLLKHFSSRN
jgi:hypothetical protein